MLVHLWWDLVQTLFKPLHEVQKVLGYVLLLTNLDLVSVVVHHTIQDGRWIDILLVRKYELRHELLHIGGHLSAQFLPLQSLQLVFDLLFLLLVFGFLLLELLHLCLILALNVCAEQLGRHVWQEEQGLDERVEIAGVSNVL